MSASQAHIWRRPSEEEGGCGGKLSSCRTLTRGARLPTSCRGVVSTRKGKHVALMPFFLNKTCTTSSAPSAMCGPDHTDVASPGCPSMARSDCPRPPLLTLVLLFVYVSLPRLQSLKLVLLLNSFHLSKDFATYTCFFMFSIFPISSNWLFPLSFEYQKTKSNQTCLRRRAA